MHTSPHVSFGIGYTVDIKPDSIPTMPNLQVWSKVDDLRTDSATSGISYATYEPNYWLLDGNYKFVPEDVSHIHVGVVSLQQSDESGVFIVAPEQLTINFTRVHSTDGLTIRGELASNNYPTNVDVAFFDDTDTLIRTDNYTPDSWEFSTGQAVANFKKIVISVSSVNNPFHYLRITGLDYGRLITFDTNAIKTATTVEEIDPLSAELRIGTLTLRLYSSDSEFSIIKPEGDYQYLNQRQPFSIYETIGATRLFIGQYYLDSWENKSETEIEFQCVDALGLLDTMRYRGGMWLDSGIALPDLLAEILVNIPFDLDVSLAGVMMKGWLPIGTSREALQQVCFAAGATVSCSRERPVKIYPTKIAAVAVGEDAVFTKAEKGIDTSLTLRPLVTAAEVTAHDFAEGTDSKELYNGTLDVNIHEITFSEPMHDLEVTGGTITDSGANYALVEVIDAPATVVLSGQVYADSKTLFGVYNTELDSNVKANVLKIEKATMVNTTNGAAITQNVYDYYQQRMVQKFKLYASLSAVGDIARVETLYHKHTLGVIEKMSSDLAFGMIEQVEIVGV